MYAALRGTLPSRNSVLDSGYSKVLSAMRICGVSGAEIEEVEGVLAGILLLGLTLTLTVILTLIGILLLGYP